MSTHPDIVFVVVTYNSGSTLGRCLETLTSELNQTQLDWRLVVWDNASADESREVAAAYTDTVYASALNVGFGAACNRAIELHPARWIALVNADAWVAVGGLSALPGVLREAPLRSFLVPTLLNADGSVQPSLVNAPTPATELGLALAGDRGASLAAVASRRRPSLRYVSGAFFVCDYLIWQETGGFDEQYFLYAEEVDLCNRGVALGAEFVPAPDLVLFHEGSQGNASKNPTTYSLLIQGKLKYIRTHHGLTHARAIWRAYRAGNRGRMALRPRDLRSAALFKALASYEFRALIEARRLQPPGSTAVEPDVLVYDPDGINPYGREVAASLAVAGVAVEHVIARDAEWTAPTVQSRRLLPGNHGRDTRLSQLLALLRALAYVVERCRSLGTVVTVLWTRSALEAFVLAFFVRRSQLAVVVHNPRRRQRQSLARRVSERLLLRRAGTLIAHSELLAAEVRAETAHSRVAVAEHPPFIEWSRQWWTGVRGQSPKRRLLFLGQLRSDKSPQQLAEVLEALSPDVRADLSLTIAGRGRLDDETASRLRSCVELVDRSSDSFISDSGVSQLLAETDVLLAPYTGATQSSTIALAVTLGIPVVAYDVGSVSLLVGRESLAESGNAQDFADRLQTVLERDRTAGTAALDILAWRTSSAEGWRAALPVTRDRRAHL